MKSRIFKIIGIAIAALFASFSIAYSQTSGNLSPLPGFIASTTPSLNVTQRIVGVPVKLTGLTPTKCLQLDSNNFIVSATSPCGSGSGGSATTTIFTGSSTSTSPFIFATTTTGSDFTITTDSAHKVNFNLPFVSSTTAGKLSPTDWITFNNKVSSLTDTLATVTGRGNTTLTNIAIGTSTAPRTLTVSSSTASQVLLEDSSAGANFHYGGLRFTNGDFRINSMNDAITPTTLLTLASTTGNATFIGTVSATGANFSGLTASKPIFTDASKNLTSTGIGTSAQFIKADGSLDSSTYLTGTKADSVSNSDGTLTVSPTTGAVVASIALGHANTWSAAQSFPASGVLIKGSSTGYNTLTMANSTASAYTTTIPANTGTVAELNIAGQTFTQNQQITNAVTTNPTLVVKQVGSQTADNLQLQDSSGNVLSKVDTSGSGYFSGTGVSTIQQGMTVNQSQDNTSNGVFTVMGSSTNLITTDNVNDRVIIATTTGTEKLTVNGNLGLATVGNGIRIKTGTNATVGSSTLSGGTATVSTTAVQAGSFVFLTDTQAGVVNIGVLTVSAISAGTSFTVTSSNVLDTSSFNWFIVNPY